MNKVELKIGHVDTTLRPVILDIQRLTSLQKIVKLRPLCELAGVPFATIYSKIKYQRQLKVNEALALKAAMESKGIFLTDEQE